MGERASIATKSISDRDRRCGRPNGEAGREVVKVVMGREGVELIT